MPKLARSEITLCVITIILFLVALVMAICVFLVTPRVISKKDEYDCLCGHHNQTQNATTKAPQPPKSGQILQETPTANLLSCVSLPKTDMVFDADNFPRRKEEYAFTVSISTYQYSDDTLAKHYLCTGVIVSNTWIFTAHGCLDGIELKQELQVRSGSISWSRGGTTHKVVKISEPRQGVVALKVQPYFRFSRTTRQLEVLLTNRKYIYTSAFTAGWRQPDSRNNVINNYNLAIRKWGINPCTLKGCTTAEFNKNISCKGKPNGEPLIPGCPILASIQVGSMCGKHNSEHFVDMQEDSMQQWAYNILEVDVSKRLNIPHADKPTRFFSQNIELYVDKCIATPIKAAIDSTFMKEATSVKPVEKVRTKHPPNFNLDPFNIDEFQIGKGV